MGFNIAGLIIKQKIDNEQELENLLENKLFDFISFLNLRFGFLCLQVTSDCEKTSQSY